MGWDESAFGWLFNKVRAYQATKDQRPRLLESSDLLAAFERLSSFVASRTMTITVVKDAGGIQGAQIFLNETHPFVCSPQEAYRLYLFKIFSLIYRQNLKILETEMSEGKVESLLAEIHKEWPLFDQLTKEVLDLWTSFLDSQNPLLSSQFYLWLGKVSDEISLQDPSDNRLKGQSEGLDDDDAEVTTELTLKRATEIKKVDLQKQENENPFVHSFEKVHTLDQYSGGLKTQDGADEMAEHSQALQELQMDTMTISTESANSLIKAGMVGGSFYSSSTDSVHADEVALKTYLYPEWDSKSRKYRKDWCRVLEAPAKTLLNSEERVFLGEDKKILSQIHRLILSVKNERRWRNGQLDGEEIDVDAALDMMVSLCAKHSPSERVYLRRPQILPDWCVLVLLDQSLSTESWIGDEQIIKLEKRIAHLMGLALDQAGIEWGLASFYSETRKAVHFDWHKRMDAKSRVEFSTWQSLMSLRPEGATRLGPVLRHGVQTLAKAKNRKKLILFISDTKPTDFDYYEGSYGANDFAKAIQEARQADIHFHVCSIQGRDQKKANQFFHPSEYSVVSKADDLVSSLRSWFPFIF